MWHNLTSCYPLDELDNELSDIELLEPLLKQFIHSIGDSRFKTVSICPSRFNSNSIGVSSSRVVSIGHSMSKA
jgi:hypothetical protein